MKKLITLVAAVALLGVAACKEADKVADYGTGKTPIEEGKKAEDQINKALKTKNQADQETLDKLDN